MSLFQMYQQLIDKRKMIEGDIDYENEPIIMQSIELLSNNIEKTNEFLLYSCTGEQFVWMSEIFEEIAEKTQNKEFIKCLYETAKRFPEETKKYNIIYFIEEASNLIYDY